MTAHSEAVEEQHTQLRVDGPPHSGYLARVRHAPAGRPRGQRSSDRHCAAEEKPQPAHHPRPWGGMQSVGVEVPDDCKVQVIEAAKHIELAEQLHAQLQA
eukprot:CAMPEP_0171115526 /NCGR_PEP_ID=MMETSP0766_2-20121228/88084_1 /TAXON_ID=439317 /ORGANISM="Gambierdiscus australes, Strain CAWD 149" /LENGTH=99 /DNA_ID=CAMNT_0011577893 /DNA_START=189 /DNA_END=484 /DNA_ORIENTATION=+